MAKMMFLIVKRQWQQHQQQLTALFAVCGHKQNYLNDQVSPAQHFRQAGGVRGPPGGGGLRGKGWTALFAIGSQTNLPGRCECKGSGCQIHSRRSVSHGRLMLADNFNPVSTYVHVC